MNVLTTNPQARSVTHRHFGLTQLGLMMTNKLASILQSASHVELKLARGREVLRRSDNYHG